MKDIELPEGVAFFAEYGGDVYTAAQVRAAVEADRAQRVPDAAAERERILGMLTRHDWHPSNIFRRYYPSVTGDWVDLRELRTLLAAAPAQPAQQEPSPIKAEHKTVTPSGTVVTRLELTDKAKESLRANVTHIPGIARHQETPQQERKPMTELHINRGSADAAADLYAAEYWSARAQEKADSDRAKGALQPVSYYVRDAIMRLSATTESRSEPC